MRKSADIKQTYEETTPWGTKLNDGDELEGVYEYKDEFDYNDDHIVKYVIKANDGIKYGVSECVVLKRLFAQIPTGSYVWIKFTGKQKSDTTKREYKTFTVDYDDEYQA